MLLTGLIIIYIGNLHYYQAADGGVCCRDFLSCFFCCCRACSRVNTTKRKGNYRSVRAVTSSSTSSGLHARGVGSGITSAGAGAAAADEDDVPTGCCDFEPRPDTIVDLERADSSIEITRVKSADADVRIVRAGNYVRLVEEALRRTPGNLDLEEELGKARDEVQAAVREKEEAEAEQKLAEAQQHHAFFLKEQFEDRQERSTFRKVSHSVTVKSVADDPEIK